MTNKHQAFVQSLRSIMRKAEEKETTKMAKKQTDENADFSDEESLSLAEELAAKFDELFGPIDDD